MAISHETEALPRGKDEMSGNTLRKITPSYILQRQGKEICERTDCSKASQRTCSRTLRALGFPRGMNPYRRTTRLFRV